MSSTGITEKVSYFKSINVGAVWLSPIFLSPQNDFGYDISDYKEIDPLYGTMSDFELMRDEFHRNGKLRHFFFFQSSVYEHSICTKSAFAGRHQSAVGLRAESH